MKKVSIIIPMYNVAPLLRTCLDSVYDQDIPEADFQVVLIDDGSPDNSLETARQLTADRTNVTIISQQNKGLGGARNTGITASDAEYLLFLDSDDWYLANSLKTLLEIAEKHSPDILEFGAQAIAPDGKILAAHRFATEKEMTGIGYKNTIGGIPSACNKLYNSDFIKRHGLLFREKIYTEDFEFNTRAFFFAQKVMATPHLVGQFLQNPNSITRTTSLSQKTKYVSDFKQIIRYLKDFAQQHVTNALQKDYIDEKLVLANFNIFYILTVNPFPYATLPLEKKQMKAEGLYLDAATLTNKKKDIFRRIFRNRFYLLRLLKLLRRR
jgi:glycosyltransferase involved in cell wall biosynthesis